MKEYYWRVKFERNSWVTTPPLKQVVDVLFKVPFETYDDNNDKHYRKFRAAAGEAFRQQCTWNSQDKNEFTGYSTTMINSDSFERAVIPHYERPLELPDIENNIPVIGCGFTHGEKDAKYSNHGYRATGFYKAERKVKRATKTLTDELIDEIAEKPLIEYNIVKCLPREATMISGAGIAGCLVLINEIVTKELVGWSELTLKQAQGEYEDEIIKTNKEDDFDRSMNWHLGREAVIKLLTKLGLMK